MAARSDGGENRSGNEAGRRAAGVAGRGGVVVLRTGR